MIDETHDTPSSFPFNKIEEIEQIIAEDEVDLWALRELCLSEGGLISDKLRRKVWPMLAGVDFSQDCSLLKQVTPEYVPETIKTRKKKIRFLDDVAVVDPSSVKTKGFKKKVMARCLDARQIDLDIPRCTWHLLSGSQRSRRRQMRNKHKKKIGALLKRKQLRLGNLINLTLVQSYANSLSDFDERRLRYYQGFHDISCIFLSTLGGESAPYVDSAESDENESNTKISSTFQQSVVASKTAKAMGLDLACKVLLQISQSHLRDSMKSNFEALTTAMRLVIMPLIKEFDPEIHEYLMSCEMEPFFCLPWIISWFSHDIRDTHTVKRLFDFFIVSHPLMPIYMSIAMLLHPCNREEVLSTECEFASVHKTLSELPRNSCSVGWKFVGNEFGGCYVSGDEETERKISMETASMLSDDMSKDSLYGDEGSMAPSLASESIYSSIDSSRVPFQELIDLAIKFMRRIPPRNLTRLANKYHGRDAHVFAHASSINLLHQPPDWALRASVPSDRARKRRSHNNPKVAKESTTENSEKVAEVIYPRAAIACGMGPDGESESRKRFWRRKRLQVGAVIVGIAAIAYSFVNSRSQYILGSSTMKYTAKNVMHTVAFGMNRIVPSEETHTKKADQILDMDCIYSDSEILESLEDDESKAKPSDIVGDITNSIKSNDEPKVKSSNIVRNIANSAKSSLAQEAEVVIL